MSDYVTRGFRAQLTTCMDSVLRRAVFEIMMIFENSLHDHQMELVQKGEEIARLKIKLQRAEKLTESERGGNRGAEINETERAPVAAPGQTSDVPEIDFEVPDDWCAPLGCETASKQEQSMCPSVRLRKLTIPLWPIPVKQEGVDHDIDSHQKTQDLGRTRSGSSLREGHTHREKGTLPMSDQETQHPPLRSDMKKLFQDLRQEYADLTGSTGPRKRGRKKRKEQENATKSNEEERKIKATKLTEKNEVNNNSKKRHTCKFCQKVFDTEFGQSVHERSHKRCRGCKKVFPFPSALKYHKQGCKKLKKLLAKEAANPPKLESCNEEKPIAPTKKQVVIQKKSASPSSNHSETSFQTKRKKHACDQCNKSFSKSWQLKQHFRVHTGERPYPCEMCPKTFRFYQNLRRHEMRLHKDQMSPSETNLAWTKPLEETEGNREAPTSPASPAINHKDVQRDHSLDAKSSPTWKTMGTRCSDGFSCSLCQKVLSTKRQLIEHFHAHTGEKPIKCDSCPLKFRSSGQLSQHKKRCGKPHKMVAQCVKCEKQFSSQERCQWHMSRCHRDQPISCNVCGKGFYLKGRLRNHMERFHNSPSTQLPSPVSGH